MKRVSLILSASLLTAMMLTSCGEDAANRVSNSDLSLTANQIIKEVDTIQISKETEGEIEQKLKQTQLKGLPKEFLGEWTNVSELDNCGFGLVIEEVNEVVTLSNGTEWGGYDGKIQKVKDYYQVDFEQRSEGESWKAKILLKMIGNNLFVSYSKENDFTKMYRCPN